MTVHHVEHIDVRIDVDPAIFEDAPERVAAIRKELVDQIRLDVHGRENGITIDVDPDADEPLDPGAAYRFAHNGAPAGSQEELDAWTAAQA